MEFLKKMIHILSWLIYILIIIYVLICAPMIFGYKPLVVLSGSMEPTYGVGSVIYYHETPKEEIKVGDAITFTYETDFITHRVVNIEDGLYETKGDANNAVDARKIGYSNIKGKVSKLYIPYIGYYVSFINKHLYLIGVVILILVSEFLLNPSKKKEEKVKEVETLDIDRKKERK